MSTEYSLWYIVPVILFALACTWFAYMYRAQDVFSKRQRAVLSSLRFVSTVLLFFLLLNPVVKTVKNRTEKPIIVILQDDSGSIVRTSDSLYYRGEYLDGLNEVIRSLGKNSQVRIHTFGSKTEETARMDRSMGESLYRQSSTDISQALNQINDMYSNQNLSAVVLASDGIATFGDNPLNTVENINCPVYTIALGDTTRYRDVAVSSLRYNKIAYIDNMFPIEIGIKADKAAGNAVQVQLLHKNKTIFSQRINIDKDKYYTELSTLVSCSEAGLQTFTAVVQVIDSERNRDNNRRDFAIEVLDSKQKIVIAAASPHPDISAMKQSLEAAMNYQVECLLGQEGDKSVAQADVIIAHQLPCDAASMQMLEQAARKRTPILYVIGKRTRTNLFNKLPSGVEITPYDKSSQRVCQAAANLSFSLFGLSEDYDKWMQQMPPLTLPLARYNTSNATHILAYQYNGGKKSPYPLISFYNTPQTKAGVICAENIWKWKMQDYRLNGSSERFDRIIRNCIQYLASNSDKSLLRVYHDKTFNQDTDIEFDAELYNQSYQLNNTPELNMSIRNAQNREFKYTFSRRNNAYHLNIGQMEQGRYTYTASAKVEGVVYKAKGSFVVKRNEAETVNLQADHSMLYTLSKKTHGCMFSPKDMKSIIDSIALNRQVKPIIHQVATNHKLSDSFMYWLVLIVCFGAEWFLRKYWGRL